VAKKAAARGAAGFTELQGQYLPFIRAYSVIHGVPPAEADMQRFFRVSAPSVHQMVVTLEHRGFVARIPGHARPKEGICVRSLFHPMGSLQ
jgi:SOS-response transcriptional repressor LexA